jgi:hypothetical protein
LKHQLLRSAPLLLLLALTGACRSKEPKLSVFSPKSSTHFTKGDTIHFASELNSEVDPGLVDSTAWQWVSDVDGVIGHGPRVETTSLTVGQHEVTAIVKHRLGTSHASVTVFVDPPGPTH